MKTILFMSYIECYVPLMNHILVQRSYQCLCLLNETFSRKSCGYILVKNDSASISFPRLDKRVFNSSLDKNPSLFTSAAENSSYNFAAYSLDSFFEKCPAEAAAMNSLKSSMPSLLISMLSSNSFTLTPFPRLFNKFSSSSLLR